MSKTVSEKSSFQLFLWGLLLLPFAYVADSVLDAVLFGQGELREQLTAPSYHEAAGRILILIFILAGIYLGMHFLAKVARRERILQQRNSDLTCAKQELEALDENAARHLRKATAGLTSAVNLLLTQNCHPDDQKLQFLIQGVSRARDRLDAQLAIFTSLTSLPVGELHRERINLERLAEEVIEILRDQWAERTVEFIVQPWMNAWCDQRLMRQILHELFSHALDSLPRDRKGRIELGMLDRLGQPTFFVRDNGLGFSETQAEHLFDPFREDHQPALPPGDTLRLARAAQLIRWHGGRIRAEGIQGASGTIYFTL